MNRRTNISDFTARVTGNYAHQISCKPFCGLYEDIHNSCMHVALKNDNTQYSITCYIRGIYRWFLFKDKKQKIMISPDFWCAAVLAAISVMMFEDLNIVFITKDSGFDSFSWAERCSVSDGLSLIQKEPFNRFFIIDGKALGQYEKKQIRQFLGEENNLRFLLVDTPENEQQWGNDWADRIVIEHTSVRSNEDCFSSFLLSALEDDEVKESLRRDEWQKLSEYFMSTRSLDTVKKYAAILGYPGKPGPIRPGDNSLLKIAVDHLDSSMNEIIAFLLKCGDTYRTDFKYYESDECLFGLGELASDSMDEENFNKICWLLENGYKAEVKELFYIAISFLHYTTSYTRNGRYLANISERKQGVTEADDKFCSEFKRLSAFFPEEVFSYRDEEGKTLLMYASKILYGRYFLPELYKMILQFTKEPWLIDNDGNNALYYLSIYGAGEEVFELFRKSDVQVDNINRNGSFCTRHFFREFQKSIEGIVDYDLYEYIPAVVDTLCFADGYRREVFKDILKKLLKDCDALQKAVFIKDGSNVLMHLISYRYDPELFDDILKAGIDINATDWAGDTALMYAIRAYWDNWNNNKKLSFLITHGVNGAIQNKIGETAIHIAARSLRIKEEGWNIIGNIKDKNAFLLSDNYGFTPVMTAFKYMNMTAMRFLMNNSYVQDSDMEYIRKQIDRVNTKSMRKELEDLYSSLKNGGKNEKD